MHIILVAELRIDLMSSSNVNSESDNSSEYKNSLSSNINGLFEFNTHFH